MTHDFLTEKCESCPGWGDFGRDSGECMYVYPGDHCEYARKVKLRQRSKRDERKRRK